jgi:hypothetical protein
VPMEPNLDNSLPPARPTLPIFLPILLMNDIYISKG